ncbi:MAG TPA: DoxX family protein [Flavobacteriales bacterium]|nr:DoxX family protein [Flavobacteriales bacterium]
MKNTPEKRNKILYWIFTVWLCLGMVSSAIVQLIPVNDEVEKISQLGYPLYFMPFLGVLKILGVAVVLAPKYPVLKEWAYAGFFFTMSGALFSHVAMGHAFDQVLPSVLLLILTAISWYFRPASRKIALTI